MPDVLLPVRRRRLLRLLAALPAAGLAAARTEAYGMRVAQAREEPGPPRSTMLPFPDGATMLVAGPQDGTTAGWARLLSPPLGRALQGGPRLRLDSVGAADGVTGANQFEARTPPDGTTALLLPGAAALAWLVGDPRAHFDAARWVPVLAGMGSGVLAGRVGASSVAPGRKLRVGAAGPAGPDLPALLGLSLLGVEVVPVFGLSGEAALMGALQRSSIDAVFLRGRRVPQRLAGAATIGAVPLFASGEVDDAGETRRDPQFPDVPTLPELFRQQRGGSLTGPLFEAWRATASAAQMEVALVLPQLTPAALVALWRRAAAQAAAAPEIQAVSAETAVRALPSPAATASIGAVSPDASALLELRRWLATRLNWKPA
jgi:hypothetical protein